MAYTTGDLQQLSTNIFILNGSTTLGILLDGESVYLVDSGPDEMAGKELLKILAEAFPGKELKAIINTQGHSDHTGANGTIKKSTKCEIWAPEAESVIIEHPEIYSAICWGGNPFDDVNEEVLTAKLPSTPDKTIKKKSLELKNLALTFYDLPGHFLDQKGILVEDKTDLKKVFFLGDSFYGVKMLIKLWIPYLSNPESFRDSVEIIEKTEADIFVPSHGGICKKDNITEIAEFNKLVTMETESLILKLLQKNPLTPDQLIKEAADYSGIKLDLKQYILAGTTIKSYLTSMKNRNLVTWKLENNQMLWNAK